MRKKLVLFSHNGGSFEQRQASCDGAEFVSRKGAWILFSSLQEFPTNEAGRGKL